MLKLLEFLEQNPHNHHDNEIEDNINALDYQKPFYGLSPYSRYGASAGAGAFETDNDDAVINGGEWLNDWIEPSVQYYGNSPYGIYDPNPRDRYATSKGKFILYFLSTFLYFASSIELLFQLHFITHGQMIGNK